MFNTGSWPTITKPVVESDVSGLESADSAVESADSTTDSAADPVKIGLWIRALTFCQQPVLLPPYLHQ